MDDPGLIGGYQTDDELDDTLFGRQEVHSLARVLSSRQTGVPRSVGLFGVPGSGKSFFAALLNREIEQLSVSPGEGTFVTTVTRRDILQVSLNAWNLIGISPWISLSEEIYKAIDTLDDRPQNIANHKLLRHLPTARLLQSRLEANARDADVALNAAVIEQQDIEHRHAAAIQEKATAKVASPWPQIGIKFRESLAADRLRQIDKDGERLGLSLLSQQPEDLYRLLEDKKTVGGKANILAGTRVARRYIRSTLLLVLAAALVLASAAFAYYVLTSVEDLKDQVTAFFGALAGVTAVIGTAGVFFASLAQNQASRALTRLQALSPLLDPLVAKERAEHDRHLLETSEQLDQLRALLSESIQRTASAKRANVIAERQLAEWQQKPLGEAITESYRSTRGSIPDVNLPLSGALSLTIRADMDALSSLLIKGPSAPDPDEQARYPTRIIAFIDELDPCGDQTVIEYMEVAQQLLAFQAFSLVFVLDPRRFAADRLTELFDLTFWVGVPTIASLAELTGRTIDEAWTAREIDQVMQTVHVLNTPRHIKRLVNILRMIRLAHMHDGTLSESDWSAIVVHGVAIIAEPQASGAYFDLIADAGNISTDVTKLYSHLASSGVLSPDRASQFANMCARLNPSPQVDDLRAWGPIVRRFSLWP